MLTSLLSESELHRPIDEELSIFVVFIIDEDIPGHLSDSGSAIVAFSKLYQKRLATMKYMRERRA